MQIYPVSVNHLRTILFGSITMSHEEFGKQSHYHARFLEKLNSLVDLKKFPPELHANVDAIPAIPKETCDELIEEFRTLTGI